MQIILDHNSAKTTETYVNTDKMLYRLKSNDNFVVKVCDDIDEAVKLTEVSFKFYTQLGGLAFLESVSKL